MADEDQGVPLDRDMMGGALGASIVHALWQDAICNAAVISTDATGALIHRHVAQPVRRPPAALNFAR